MNRPPLPPSAAPDAAASERDEALAWFVRRNNETFSSEDERAFRTWLNAHPARQGAMARWQAEWQAFDAIPAETRQRLKCGLAMDKARQSAERELQAVARSSSQPLREEASGRAGVSSSPSVSPARSESHARARSSLPPLSRHRVLAPAFAAVVAVAGSVGAGLTAWSHWQAQPVYAQSFSTPRGQQADIALPDGSSLRLDAATRLQVTYYRQYREVRLSDGQAVFSVHADARRPFHVSAGPVRVTAVGTRFMVRHTPGMPGDAGVLVAVEEGRVRVERAPPGSNATPATPTAVPDAPGPEAVFLGAGQDVSSDALGTLAAVSMRTGAGFALWRENRVRFDNTRLDRALAELARYRDPQLVVRDPAAAALRITGVFDPRDPATFRRVLPMSLPVKLREDGGTAEVVLAR